MKEQQAAGIQLSWVAPMYGTRSFVEALCHRIGDASAALGLRHEIVLVDDACPQRSAEEARRIASKYPLRLVCLSSNQGQDAALRAGLRVCTGEWAMILDADLQDPPEALARMWPEAQLGFDAVFADRRGRYESPARLLTSAMYRTTVRLLGRLPRGAGLFALIGKRCYQAVANAADPPDSLLAGFASLRGRYTSVPVMRARRSQGHSAYRSIDRLRKGLRSMAQVLRARQLRRTDRPDLHE